MKRLSALLLALLLSAPLGAQTIQPGGGGSPTGAAGGGLTGTYPNPTVATVPSSSLPAGQYPGTATNDDAAAGNIGEVKEGSLGIAVSNLTTGVAAALVGISLTAGDWEVYYICYFTTTSTTTVTNERCGPSTTSALDGTVGNNAQFQANAVVVGAGENTVAGPPVRYSLASSTTINLIAQSAFGGSTMKIGGKIRAIRTR
jgi:hypothetical protein